MLLVVMILASTAALALGLALRGVNENPFARTRAATKGPDVVAQLGYAPGLATPSPKAFAPLLHVHGVTATAGPFPVAQSQLTAKGISVPVQAEGVTSSQRPSSSRCSPPASGRRAAGWCSSRASRMRSACTSETPFTWATTRSR